MNIIELVRICHSTRKKVLRKLNFIISTILFNILLNKEDTIPEIGKAKLKTRKDVVYLEIELESRWQKLLSSNTDTNDIADTLITHIKEQVGG